MKGVSFPPGSRYALLPLVLVLAGCKPAPDFSGCPNVVLICVESLRADHLGCYGYDRETSPVIDSLAACGILWTNCQSHSPWTIPACASLWTGLSPQAHRAGWSGGTFQTLDPGLPTIASVLGSRGYATAGFMGSRLLGRRYGFDRGFDLFSPGDDDGGTASYTVQKAAAWMDSVATGEERFLLIVHLFDPHPPHDAPEPYASLWADLPADSHATWWSLAGDSLADPGQAPLLTALYDAEIRFTDEQIGFLCGRIRAAGIADSTVILVTSSHGEEFLDHGWIGSSHSLHGELIRVPLILSGAGMPAGERRGGSVGLFDILPTVAVLAGAEIPMNVEGCDLFSDSLQPSRPIPAGALLPDLYARDEDGERLLPPVNTVAVIAGDLKVIYDVLADSMTQYDLAADPLEAVPLPPTEEMALSIERLLGTPPQGNPKPLEDETLGDTLGF